MKCPNCEEEIPGSPSPECGATAPDGANYCMECGSSLVREEAGSLDNESGFDLEDRALCPDGTCTGIIVDGKCTDCGKVPGEEETSEGE